MKEKRLQLIFCFVFIIFALGIVSAASILAPNPGHSSNQVFVPVGNNTYITLQNAIDSAYIIGGNLSSVTTTAIPTSSPYEFASQLLITAYGKNMTLQEAINTNVFKNKNPQAGYPYTNLTPAGGDLASNTNVSVSGIAKSLQTAIADNSLLSVVPNGQICYLGSTSCSTAGTWFEGSCLGSSDLVRGTTCSGGTCDGSGNCQSWSGSGCSAADGKGPNTCPFGYTSSSGNYFCNLVDSAGLKYAGQNHCGSDYNCNCPLTGSCQTCFSATAWGPITPFSSASFSCAATNSCTWQQAAGSGCIPADCSGVAGATLCSANLGKACASSSAGSTMGCIIGGQCTAGPSCRTGALVCE